MKRWLVALFLSFAWSTATLVDAATITPTVALAAGLSLQTMQVITWSGMAGADTPVSTPTGHCIDLTVQITGTFGTTTVTLQGSMDDTTYATLNDTAGTPAALSFTTAGYKHVQERANYLKVGLSGGTGTALKVQVLCRQQP